MSFNSSSFLTPAEETFSRIRGRDSLKQQENSDSSFILNSLNNELNSNRPIKSLIESPFRGNLINKFNSSTDYEDANSLLKKKIQMKQLNFRDNLKNLRKNENSNFDINNETIMHSAFRSRRDQHSNEMTNLKNIGSSKSCKNLKENNSNSSDNSKNTNNSSNIGIRNEISDENLRIAASRIVDKNNEIKKIILIVFLYLVYKFLRSLIKLIIYKNLKIIKIFNNLSSLMKNLNFENKLIKNLSELIGNNLKFENVIENSTYFEYFLNIFMVILIIQPIYLILKPKDDCLDIPLTNGQRKILGLPLINEEDNCDKELEKLVNFGKSLKDKYNENNNTKIFMPNSLQIEDLMGSLNSLKINKNKQYNNSNNNNNNSNDLFNTTLSGGESTEKLRQRINQKNYNNFTGSSKDFITPNGKFLYDYNNEIKNQNHFGNMNSSFY